MIRQSAEIQTSLRPVLKDASVPPGPDTRSTQHGPAPVEAIRGRAEIVSAMATHAQANAELAKSGVEESLSMITGIQSLVETTRMSARAADRMFKAVLGLTVALVLMTAVITYLTWVLVAKGG